MDSIGRLLSQARERRGMTQESIARETNISRNYIAALEADDYRAFPGEPYLVGFLRTYAEYLDLNPEDILALYKNLKIQDQPAPMEVLLRTARPFPMVAVVLGALVVLLVGLVVWRAGDLGQWLSGMGAMFSGRSQDNRVPENVRMPVEQKDIERRFFLKDTLEIQVGDTVASFVVRGIDEALLLVGGPGETRLRLGQQSFLDLDGNATSDIRLALMDIDTSDPTQGVSLSVLRLDAVTEIPNAGTVVAGSEIPVALLRPTGIRPERVRPSVTVSETSTAQPFQVEVVFRGSSLFRYQADDNPREEGLWDKGEIIRIAASRQVILAGSNAGAFVVRVNGREVEMGEGGQVSARILRWVRAGTGYQLRLDPLY